MSQDALQNGAPIIIKGSSVTIISKYLFDFKHDKANGKYIYTLEGVAATEVRLKDKTGKDKGKHKPASKDDFKIEIDF